MKKELFLVLALSTVSSAAVLAQSSSDPSTYPGSSSSTLSNDATDPQARPLESQFNLLDSNQQGYLTRSDAARDSDLSNHFSQADANSDGKITVSEYIVYKETAMGSSDTGGASSSDRRGDSYGSTESNSTGNPTSGGSAGAAAGAAAVGDRSASHGNMDESVKRDTSGRGAGSSGARSNPNPTGHEDVPTEVGKKNVER